MRNFVSSREVADQLGTSPRQVARMVERGDLVAAQKLPGRTGAFLFDPDVIDAHIGGQA